MIYVTLPEISPNKLLGTPNVFLTSCFVSASKLKVSRFFVANLRCDAAPYFRVFNPTTQQEKFDKNFEYIKKWVPEFGTSNYPEPIIEHKFARERVLERFKQALNN